MFLPPQQEQLSLSPVKITFNDQQVEDTHVDLASDFIHKPFQPKNLIKLLYTQREKLYIEANVPKPLEATEKNIVPLIPKYSSTPLQVLQILNSIILRNDLDLVVTLFKKTHIAHVIIGWLDKCQNPIDKALCLNIVCVCSGFLADNQAYNSSEIIASLLNSSQSVTKKHLIALMSLLYHKYIDIDTKRISYTMKPFISNSTQLSMANLNYLLYDPPPKAIQEVQDMQKQLTISQEYIDYLNGSPMADKSHNDKARVFLTTVGAQIPKFVEYLAKALHGTSRFLNSSVKYDPIYDVNIENPQEESDLQCDITTLSIWATLFVVHQYLLTSNQFDAEIFNHFVAKYDFVPYMLQSIHNINVFFFDNDGELRINESSVVLAIQSMTNLLLNSPSRISQYITEAGLQQLIKSVETIEIQSIKAVLAKLIAVSCYWIPREQIGPTPSGPNLTLVNFVYLNLEQFEFYQRLSCDKGSIPPCLESQTYFTALKEYATKLGLKLVDQW